MPDTNSSQPQQKLTHKRRELLHRLNNWLEAPMVVLGFIWLMLLIVELTRGLNPFFELLGTVIWGLFIVDFGIKLILAPQKVSYLKEHWLTAISLMLPALRIFRAARAIRLLRVARTARGLRLVRVLTSINRGMKALGNSMSRRGFGYVTALSALVLFSGAAGMYTFERQVPEGLASYGEALWWTAMLLITIGSEYWPQTPEGRMLSIVLALYGFAVFGYVTATLASFFIGQDTQNQSPKAADQALDRLRAEIKALREEVQTLRSDQTDDT